MIETVIMAMIYLVLFAIAVYIVLWVLEQLGISIPPQIMKLLWVLVVLVVILVVVRLFLPAIGVRGIGRVMLPTNLAFLGDALDCVS